MYAHCSSFIATSLDGFISRSDGSIDWLEKANETLAKGDDCGYSDYIATVNGIVMGRRTFELALSFEKWPYDNVAVYVLSSSWRSLPANSPRTATLHSGSPNEIAALALSRGHRSLYVDGGKTIQGFIAKGLLQEITVTVIPVLLGTGRPLFGPVPAATQWLNHVSSRVFPFGFVQNRYIFRRSDA
jgi:dihydrofolate reductase